MTRPTVVGIIGGSGSGKTIFLAELQKQLGAAHVSVLTMDNYYIAIENQPVDDSGIENFDMPESLDRSLFKMHLDMLLSGQEVLHQEYTFNNEAAVPAEIRVAPSPIILLEGIFTMHYSEVRDLLDLKVYIDAPDYLMLTRRISRDAKERGYDLDDVLYRYQNHVTPAFKKYIEPWKYEADIIVPNHQGFDTALQMVSAYLKTRVNPC